MNTKYFSDREMGERPRDKDEITPEAWDGIVAIIKSRIYDGSFGYRYPKTCEDRRGICGCDEDLFRDALKAVVPEIPWPLDWRGPVYPPNYVKLSPPLQDEVRWIPSTPAIMDLIEFCYKAVSKPIQKGYHKFFDHYHFQFDPNQGQAEFRDDINRILARNSLAYTLGDDGSIVRLAPVVLREDLICAVFRTGDTDLDSLLEAARTKYLDPDIEVRKEALEKLWDAWERLKTVESGKNKKASTKALLDKAVTEQKFREMIEEEANKLTDIGNNFMIRHSETYKVPIRLSEHVDYLFHRMFSLIRLLLKTTGRGR